jgi:hypothetical protein
MIFVCTGLNLVSPPSGWSVVTQGRVPHDSLAERALPDLVTEAAVLCTLGMGAGRRRGSPASV